MTNLIEGSSGFGAHGLMFTKAILRSTSGKETRRFAAGEFLEVELEATASQDIVRPNLGYAIYTPGGHMIYCVGITNFGSNLAPLKSGETCCAVFQVELALAPGRYTVTLFAGDNSAAHTGDGGNRHDTRERVAEIEVVAGPASAMLDGIGALPVTVTHWVV